MPIRGAKVLVVSPEHDVLILTRSKTHPYVPLSNDLPGGKVEVGETNVEGVARELREETGLELPHEAFHSIGRRELHNFYGKNYHIELFVTRLHEKPDVKLSYEHNKFTWKPVDQLNTSDEAYGELIEKFKNSQ